MTAKSVLCLENPAARKKNRSRFFMRMPKGRPTLGTVLNAEDEQEHIGEGSHERMVVNVERFEERARKTSKPSA